MKSWSSSLTILNPFRLICCGGLRQENVQRNVISVVYHAVELTISVPDMIISSSTLNSTATDLDQNFPASLPQESQHFKEKDSHPQTSDIVLWSKVTNDCRVPE